MAKCSEDDSYKSEGKKNRVYRLSIQKKAGLYNNYLPHSVIQYVHKKLVFELKNGSRSHVRFFIFNDAGTLPVRASAHRNDFVQTFKNRLPLPVMQ